MSLERRITAILTSPKPGAAPAVRTSDAFAARFRADAERSGLTVDLEEKDAGAMVRVCPVCGAQNGRLAETCFNCQTELGAAPPPAAKPKPLDGEDSARWRNITRAASLATRVPLNAGRFTPYAAQRIDERQVLGRFLSVFVEREATAPRAPPASVARFDQATMLDKFLSTFVERSTGVAPAPAPPPVDEKSVLSRFLGVFIERG